MANFIRVGSSLLFIFIFSLLFTFSPFAEANANADEVTVRAELGQNIIYAKRGEKIYLRLDLEAIRALGEAPRAPVNVAIVIDQSGSMGGAKIAQAKEAAKFAVNRLGEGDIISLIAYSDRVDVLVPATIIEDRSYLRDKINDIRAHGRTALYDGTKRGIGELEKFLSENKVNRVILLSDGLANIGPSQPSDLEALGRRAAQKGIAITTIGLGLGYNEDLMTRLAFASDGNHAFVRHADDLVGIFDKEFGDVLSVIAQAIEIRIDIHVGIRPIRILGRQARIDGQKVTLRLNQLYGGQEKHVILEGEIIKDLPQGRRQERAHTGCQWSCELSLNAERFTATS